MSQLKYIFSSDQLLQIEWPEHVRMMNNVIVDLEHRVEKLEDQLRWHRDHHAEEEL